MELPMLPRGSDPGLTDAVATIAFDRASSRSFDQDGHLHVVSTNISKAAVNPYLGREIPNFEALGLDADRVYNLLRDPEELAKAVETFNGKPLLFDHKPVHAEDHDHGMTVGSLGNARYVAPYLKADISVWSGPAIRAVEDGSQKELSSAYRYRADMTPGTFQGARYDGVMRDIACNHVALVAKGRAGSDVVVGDSETGIQPMKTRTISQAGAVTHGALAVYLRPKLAMDAKIDLAPMTKGLTAKNFGTRKAGIITELKKLTTGKLAQDADIEDAIEVLEALAPILPPDVVEEVAEEVADSTEPKPAEDDGDDMRAKLAAAGLSEEDITKVLAALADDTPPAMDESEEDKAKRLAKLAQDTTAMKNMVTKPAMDAAIAAAVRTATATATKTQRDIREAERAVRPYVGDLAMAHDSAEEVYRTALTTLGVKIEGVHPSALPTILALQPKAGDTPKRQATPIAQDAATATAYAERFPNANRLK